MKSLHANLTGTMLEIFWCDDFFTTDSVCSETQFTTAKLLLFVWCHEGGASSLEGRALGRSKELEQKAKIRGAPIEAEDHILGRRMPIVKQLG